MRAFPDIEKALRESEAKFRILSETTPSVILIYRDEKLCFANRAAEAITGYSKEQLLKMSFFDLVHPAFRELARNESLRLQRGELVTSRYEIKLVTREGGERWADITARGIEYAGKPSVLVTAYDITKAKQAEEELRESEGRMNAIIQGSPIPQFVIGKDHRVIYWNRALEQYSRIKSADMVGTTDQWRAFYGEKRPCLADLLVDGAVDEIPRWYGGKYSKSRHLDEAYEATDFFPALGESGKWLYFTATVIRDSAGGIIGAVETLEDITERKRAEEQLDEAKKQAEIYLELMGHDINNLNQAGIGYLELALQTPGLDETIRQLLAKPLEALKDSSRLIANVDKLQRISAGKLASERMDLGKVLADVRQRYLDIPGRDITINYAPATQRMVMANALLVDVFSNILGNAVKHSSGPLTIDISLKKVPEGGREYYKVTVDDNGPGIPDELKARLFTRFQRGKTGAGGKGLGLYLVRALVENFGGRVWAEDRVPGDHTKGSRFVVMLPAPE